MSTSFYYSYFASKSLLANTNRTDLVGPSNIDTMTEWLKSSYNATVGTSTDMLDLLSQLKHNSAFNPYDAMDDYITNLENTPLGNMRNDDLNNDGQMDDHDYRMFTQGDEVAGFVNNTIATGQTSHPGYKLGSAFTGHLGFCFKSDDDIALYDKIIAGTAKPGENVTYYRQNGATFDLKNISASTNNSDYASGIEFDAQGFIKPASKTLLSDEVDSFMTAGKIVVSGKSINLDSSSSEADLTAVYKQLVDEMKGLKEYTLTNQEILSMKSEIATLNSDGVKGNLEGKIAKAQDELKQVFDAQMKKIDNTSYMGIFENYKPNSGSDPTPAGAIGDIDTALNSKVYSVSVPVSTVGTQGIDSVTGLPVWSYENKTYANATDSVDVIKYDGGSTSADKALFGTDSNGKYDFVNNPFYQYMVALRTDKDLKFEKSFNEAVPTWNTQNNQIAKKGDQFCTGWDPSKYSNIKQGDEKLGPVEVLKNLYGTQELLALYKQYEDSQNKANSLTLGLNVALQDSAEFDFRKVLAGKVLDLLKQKNPLITVDLSATINTADNLVRGCSTGPSSLKNYGSIIPTFDGYYGDQNILGQPKSAASDATQKLLVDPYVVTINGTKYVLGQDGDSNGNIDNVSEILGINDSQDNPFTSLIALDANKDGKVSQEELLNNNIVLKAIDNSGKLSKTSFDTALVSGIDLSQIDKTKNGNVAGTFSMKLANGSTVQGQQTFDDQAYFNTLFGKIVDLKPYQTAATTTASTTTKSTTTKPTTSTTAASTTATAVTTPVVTDSLVHKNLLKQINSAYSALIIDDTSNIEETLDNICWKHSVSLTPAQRVKIMDGIDPLLSSFEVEKKIVSAISVLNLKA